MGQVFEITAGGTPSRTSSEYWGGSIPWVKIGDMKGKYVNSTSEFITEKGLNNSSAKVFEEGTLLYSVFASIGTVSILGIKATTNQAIAGLSKYADDLDTDYMYWALVGLKDVLLGQARGMAQLNINQKILSNAIVPIPPFSEQKRIAKKVDELMARVADLEQSADALASLKKAFPDDIKASLLQAAMQGKLTEQLPEDGNAEELLEQIKFEKEKLVAEGKIKKQKPLAPITDDEIPFSIPENWKWVRWGDIINIVSARRVHQSDWKKNGIPFYRAREIGKLADYDSVDNDLFVSQELFNEYSKSGLPKKNDLMVTAVGTLGKTYVVKESDKFYYKDASVLCFENYHCDPFFLKYLMSSDIMKSQIESNSGGTTVGTLTIVRMNDYILPLPPLDEQKRIVERLNILIQNINVVGELIASE